MRPYFYKMKYQRSLKKLMFGLISERLLRPIIFIVVKNRENREN